MLNLKLASILAAASLLAGCAGAHQAYQGPTYVPVAQPRVAPLAATGLQACSNHAAAAEAAVADDFRVLRFDTERLVNLQLSEHVGSQPIARVLDGVGARYGAKEYALVRFHCLADAGGRVVYSFVRPE